MPTPLMRDSRNDIQLKIDRADQHFKEFMGAVAKFQTTNPYRFRIERDFETREPVYRLTMIDEVPPDIPIIAGDVLQNLRSALDYLVYALVRRNGKVPHSQTAFPISDDAPTTKDQKTTFVRKVEGIRQDVIDKIGAIKPYKGGNDILWRLHRLNNIDKHRLLFTTQAIMTATNAGNPGEIVLPPMVEHAVGVPNVPFPLKEGDEIRRDPPNAEIDQNAFFFSEIALNEPEVSTGYPLILISVLRKSFRTVQQIITDFRIDLM